MKLSTELALTNLVLLGVLWYCALNGMPMTSFFLLGGMLAIRKWSMSAADKERAAEMAVAKARLRAIIDRKFKDAP